MSRKNPANIPASVRQKILNKARNDKRPFAELVQYYCMERFLYRLSISEHRTKFILKGALLLRAWGLDQYRPTMDIDVLGIADNNSESIIKKITDICSVQTDDDGLFFDKESIKSEQITEGADYVGNRVTFEAKLDTVRIKMQVDIGCGDSVFPDPKTYSLPCILDYPEAELVCYNPETSIAEKLEAMIKLDELNSRIKDFYDIILLAKSADIEKSSLAETIIKTFQKRGTNIPEKFIVFSEEFISKRQTAWKAFLRKNGIQNVTDSFDEAIESIKQYIEPVLSEIKKSKQH